MRFEELDSQTQQMVRNDYENTVLSDYSYHIEDLIDAFIEDFEKKYDLYISSQDIIFDNSNAEVHFDGTNNVCISNKLLNECGLADAFNLGLSLDGLNELSDDQRNEIATIFEAGLLDRTPLQGTTNLDFGIELYAAIDIQDTLSIEQQFNNVSSETKKKINNSADKLTLQIEATIYKTLRKAIMEFNTQLRQREYELLSDETFQEFVDNVDFDEDGNVLYV